MAEPVIVSGTPLVTARRQQPTKRYRLKAGKKNHHHMVDGETFIIREGDTVELTAHQAQAFGDKFEPVAEGFEDVHLDRAAGVVNREGGDVTSTDGVKTTTPGEKPAAQPPSPTKEVAPGQSVGKNDVKTEKK